MRQFTPCARGLVAAVLVLGLAAEVHAAFPRGILLQRRGNNRMQVPAKPTIIDSSETVETLNKALKYLGATDLGYDGHREKAIGHIAEAIQHLETTKTKGKSNAAVEKAAKGTSAAPTKTATTPQAASDESLHKAKKYLFSAHHQLADHTTTRGQIKADVEVRRAIDELVAALKPSTTTPTPTASPTTTSTTPGRTAK